MFRSSILLLFLFFATVPPAQGQSASAFPRPSYQRTLANLSFEKDTEGWQAETRARVIQKNGNLLIEGVEKDPAIYRLFDSPCTQLRLRMRLKTRVESSCQIFWLTQEMPRRDSDRMVSIPLQPDDDWHDYEVVLPVLGQLNCLSLKLIGKVGAWSIDSMQLTATVPHPLLVKNAVRDGRLIRYTIVNPTLKLVPFSVVGTVREQTLEPKQSVEIPVPIKESGNIAEAGIQLDVKGFPRVGYPVFLYLPDGKTEWLKRPLGPSLQFEIAPDARIARISRLSLEDEQENQIVALIAPIVQRNGAIPEFKAEAGPNENSLLFSAPNAKLQIDLAGDEIDVRITPASDQPQAANENGSPGHPFRETVAGEPGHATPKTGPADASPSLADHAEPSSDPNGEFEGPVVRVLGPLQAGLLCGVEFLGPGETSSSPIDIAEPGNIRSAPPPGWITLPLAVLASDQVAVGLLWNETRLQPTFASPNTTDLATDHRMSLRGPMIEARLRFLSETGGPAVPEMIRWAIERRGLPEVPPLPRTEQEQTALSLAAFEGPLLGSDNMSWGYYAEADSPREPFADVLSTLYRLNGTLPRVSSIVPEGSVLTNDAIYFLTNRTQEWKDIRGADVQRNLEEMNPDGTYSQRSLFPELEPDQRTSLGLCARKAAFLLDYARITGDRRSLDAAEKTLRWMQTRDVPRGGYYWETPFHTPDILSASYALWAMVRGFELTNKPEYLEEAKRFALLGLPFVYQWGDRPIMTYTVVPMFGASERERAWFWTAQPWAGLIYAYALNLLAPHDTSVDWKKIATGILVAAEQMQYPDGYYIGCLPDAFSLESQTRQLPTLNPCGLVSLRRAIEGKVDSLDVISNGPETLVSPFPLQPNKKGALVREVPAGFTFEVLFNGQRSQSIQGSGSQRDQIAF